MGKNKNSTKVSKAGHDLATSRSARVKSNAGTTLANHKNTKHKK